MPDGGTIRRRVARILALPLVAVIILLAVVASSQVEAYQDARSTSTAVRTALVVQKLVQELQTERGVTAGVLGGNPSFTPELAPARRDVDRVRAQLDNLSRDGGTRADRIRRALRGLDGIGSIRAATDSVDASRQVAFTYYTERISTLLAIDLGLENSTDQGLRTDAAALQALQDHTEAAAQERAFLNGVFSAGGFSPGEYVSFAQMRASRQAARARFERFATDEAKAGMASLSTTAAAELSDHFEQVAIDVADGRRLVVNPQSWWSGMATVLDDLDRLQRHVGSHMQQRAHTLQVDVERRLAAIGLLTILGLAATVHLALVAARSITRPLAAMASEADQVALQRLPEAVRRVQESVDGSEPVQPPPPVHVPARSTVEIQSVAAALDRLQSAAFGLATDQARQRKHVVESLANLGRRNQNLIRRQLGFITALEHEEIDPTALANLFELDHLATRMRRNAASLLVLVGASSPRQWTYPIPVADVIRAAVSDVEEYRRVALRRIDDAYVQGTAVGSIAHLLSELIENGLTFSPPDSEVEVHGRRTAEGYLIAITDQGVGMSNDDVRIANSRLRGEGDFLAAPSRFLGHYVVGRLAQETSVEVELLPSPVNGITARVRIPHALLAAKTDPSSPTGGTGAAKDVTTVAAVVSGPGPALTGVAQPAAREDVPVTAREGIPVIDRESIPVIEVAPHQSSPEESHAHAPSGQHAPQPRPGTSSGTELVPAADTTSTGVSPPAAPEPVANSGPRSGQAQSRQTPARADAAHQLPDTVSDLLGSHPLVHPFTGDLRITAPNPPHRSGRPSGRRSASHAEQSGGISNPEDPGVTVASTASHRPAPAAAAAGQEPGRTRNGLRKRTPRQTRSAAGAVRTHTAPASRSAVLDDSPVQVSSRLTALRAGIERGKKDSVVVSGLGDGSEQGGQRRE